MKSARIALALGAALVITIGFFGAALLDRILAPGYLLGALTLGGGFLICLLFSLKMPVHALAGSAVLSLLAIARGILNAPSIATKITGPAPIPAILEAAVIAICLAILFIIYRTWQQKRAALHRDIHKTIS